MLETTDYCQLYGSVYIERERTMADYTFFIEEDEAFSDLVVYEVSDALFANKEGLWYITTKKAFANHIIYLESNQSRADFSVYFTDIESLVGCK